MNAPDLSILTANLWVCAPAMALSALAALVLLAGVFRPGSARVGLPVVCVMGLGLTVWLTLAAAHVAQGAVGMLRLDTFAEVFDLFIVGATALAVVISAPYLNREELERGEYYALLLFSASGAMVMAGADNLIMLFLGLEILSLPLYVLAGFARRREESEEAALKYFLLGAFASAFLLFGAAAVYAAVGTASLQGIRQVVAFQASHGGSLLALGLGFVLVGLAFKVALAPFHMWTPDVYQGAPTPVTAFMAVVAKAAGFAALVRIAAAAVPPGSSPWGTLLWGLSAATMVWGNLLAISQQNIKRMLAYSSIGHAGYLALGVLAGGADGFSAVLYYLVVYAVTILGAFGVVITLSGKGGRFESLNSYRGVARRSPAAGALMAVFMFSLAGVPPFAGFFGKLYLFMAAVRAGYVGLTVVAVLTSLMAVYYYLRVTVLMWMEEAPAGPPDVSGSRTLSVTLVVLAAGVLLLGVLSSPVLRATDLAAHTVIWQNGVPANTPWAAPPD